MLRPYLFVDHHIQKIELFVNYIFLDVICKAPELKRRYRAFKPEMVKEEYRPLLTEVNAKYLLNPLKVIYRIAKDLSPDEINLIELAVINNNRIEELCSGVLRPVLYSDLAKINAELAKQIKLFCNYLNEKVEKLKPFEDTYSNLTVYYKKLIRRSITCRCCGVGMVLNKYHDHRSALDHYLPKDKYPFVSMNFHNMMPICDVCNSKYKLAENTLYLEDSAEGAEREEKRVKAFYPYRDDIPDIKISLSLREGCRIDELDDDDITLDFNCEAHQEEVDNWRRVFGIDNNYKAIYCSDEMYGYFEEDYIANKTRAESPGQYIEDLERDKYVDKNFLKIPILRYIHSDD